MKALYPLVLCSAAVTIVVASRTCSEASAPIQETRADGVFGNAGPAVPAAPTEQLNRSRPSVPAKECAKLLNSRSEKARERGMRRLLGRHADHPDVPLLLIDAVAQALKSKTATESTLWMIRSLGRYDQPDVVDALLGWLDEAVTTSESSEPMFQIIETMAKLNQPRVHRALIELLDAQDHRIVILATDVLGHQKCESALEPIQTLVFRPAYQSRYGFRFSVLNAVSQFDNTKAVGFLIAQLPSLGGQLKFLAVEHLSRVTRQRFGGDVQQWARWWAAQREAFQISGENGPSSDDYVWDYPVPKFYDYKIYGKRIVFVIDVSSTMRQRILGGLTRLDRAKAELSGAVAKLPHDATFNIIAFDRNVHAWESVSVPASASNKQRALRAVRALRSGAGTAIFDGLDAAFRADPNNEAIYLLTDGLPTAGRVTDPVDIVSVVTRENRFRKVAINTIAVGRRSEFLIRLSKFNYGSYRRSG